MTDILPNRREEKLVAVDMPDETLIYDLSRHRAYCFNRTAALVWRHCDGTTTAAQMAAIIKDELNMPADEELVRFAVDQIEKARLLREPVPWEHQGRVSRRELLRKAALVGAAVLVPTVITILAPTAAQAVTCVQVTCGSPGTLCPGGAADVGKPCGPPGCTCTCKQIGGNVRCRT